MYFNLISLAMPCCLGKLSCSHTQSEEGHTFLFYYDDYDYMATRHATVAQFYYLLLAYTERREEA